MRYCSRLVLGTRAGCRRRRRGRRLAARGQARDPADGGRGAQDVAQPHTDRRQSPECDPAAGRPAAERKHAQRNRRLRYPGPSHTTRSTPLRPRLRDCGGTALLVLRVPPSLVATWLAIDTARLNLRSFCSDRPILRPSLLIAYPGATDCARFTSDNLRIESRSIPKECQPGLEGEDCTTEPWAAGRARAGSQLAALCLLIRPSGTPSLWWPRPDPAQSQSSTSSTYQHFTASLAVVRRSAR